MRLLLVVNASASSVTARARVVIQKALSADHDVSVAETSRRGHASKLAQGAASQGMDAVVVLGGDGTLNEAANGLAGTATALGVLPGGSTNVFARTIGIINDPIEATGQLLAALAADSIRPINLGNVNGRYFLFHVGIGFDAAVVALVEKRASLKRWAGHPLFLYSAVRTWASHYDRSKPRFALQVGDPRAQCRPTSPGQFRRFDDAYFAVCLNTNPYTFLGNRPVDVAPRADLDSQLSIVVLRTLDLVTLLRLTASALRGGRGVESVRKVVTIDDVSNASVEGYGPVPFQVDGDYVGEADHLRVSCHNDALRLVIPPTAL